MTGQQAHWDAVYGARDEDALTWFERVPEQSLELIARHGRPDQAVVDIGGGASRLPDALREAGFLDVTVLDLSEAALQVSRDRLGVQAERVQWIAASVTEWTPERTYALWHDRAVFHFLVAEADRTAYLGTLARAVVPGGHAIIATFAEDGPDMCSNLPVQQYSSDALMAEVERVCPGAFARVEALRHVHVTPKGNTQAFQITVLVRL